MYIPNPVPEGHTETLQLTVIPQVLAWYIQYQHIYSTDIYSPNGWKHISNTNIYFHKCTFPTLTLIPNVQPQGAVFKKGRFLVLWGNSEAHVTLGGSFLTQWLSTISRWWKLLFGQSKNIWHFALKISRKWNLNEPSWFDIGLVSW